MNCRRLNNSSRVWCKVSRTESKLTMWTCVGQLSRPGINALFWCTWCAQASLKQSVSHPTARPFRRRKSSTGILSYSHRDTSYIWIQATRKSTHECWLREFGNFKKRWVKRRPHREDSSASHLRRPTRQSCLLESQIYSIVSTHFARVAGTYCCFASRNSTR